MPPRVPSKKQTLLAYLSRGVTMLHLDARRSGVVVPQQYGSEAHLRLNLSYRYAIPDLDISEERVQATLSFSGQHFQCQLPWESIFGITSHSSGDGQVWPEDLPVEVMQTLADRHDRERPRPSQANAQQAASAKARPALSPVPQEDPLEGEADGPPKAPDGPAPKRHLRLVR
jgi:stringent starvation protein B